MDTSRTIGKKRKIISREKKEFHAGKNSEGTERRKLPAEEDSEWY